jgi:hypothetical protein
MYRICDLEDINDSKKKLRRNVQEKNAVQGMGIQFSDTPGAWTIKRVHGYSTIAD